MNHSGDRQLFRRLQLDRVPLLTEAARHFERKRLLADFSGCLTLRVDSAVPGLLRGHRRHNGDEGGQKGLQGLLGVLILAPATLAPGQHKQGLWDVRQVNPHVVHDLLKDSDKRRGLVMKQLLDVVQIHHCDALRDLRRKQVVRQLLGVRQVHPPGLCVQPLPHKQQLAHVHPHQQDRASNPRNQSSREIVLPVAQPAQQQPQRYRHHRHHQSDGKLPAVQPVTIAGVPALLTGHHVRWRTELFAVDPLRHAARRDLLVALVDVRDQPLQQGPHHNCWVQGAPLVILQPPQRLVREALVDRQVARIRREADLLHQQLLAVEMLPAVIDEALQGLGNHRRVRTGDCGDPQILHHLKKPKVLRVNQGDPHLPVVAVLDGLVDVELGKRHPRETSKYRRKSRE
eukprot:RCo043347